LIVRRLFIFRANSVDGSLLKQESPDNQAAHNPRRTLGAGLVANDMSLAEVVGQRGHHGVLIAPRIERQNLETFFAVLSLDFAGFYYPAGKVDEEQKIFGTRL